MLRENRLTDRDNFVVRRTSQVGRIVDIRTELLTFDSCKDGWLATLSTCSKLPLNGVATNFMMRAASPLPWETLVLQRSWSPSDWSTRELSGITDRG